MKLYNLVLCCQSCHQNTGSYLAITGTDKTKYKYCLSNEEMQLSETCSSNSHMTLLFQSVSVKTEDESISDDKLFATILSLIVILYFNILEKAIWDDDSNIL